MSEPGASELKQTQSPILWGAYLACSWTWCIGMFFPALLLRDHGWAGFIVFAIPNVLGAAAMGWFIKSRVDSQRFVENHPNAVWWFSTITLIFHVFWMLWIANFIRIAFPIPDTYLGGVAGAVIAFSIVSGRAVRFGRAPQLAIVLLAFSVGVLLATFAVPDLDPSRHALIDAAPKTIAPLWMVPLMTFGFLLCPYLDITFHHARQQLDTQKNGRLGFTIGFVAFFSLMILLTTRYSGVMAWAMQGEHFPDSKAIAPWLGAILLTHILCQWIFTVRVHLDRMRTIPGAQTKQPILFILALIAGLAGMGALKLPEYADLSGGEILYRTFLSFYGLLFPTYMLYRAVLGKKNKSSFSLMMMWVAIAVASPMFWIGFMARESIWLIPGMGVVLAGAVIVRLKSTATT